MHDESPVERAVRFYHVLLRLYPPPYQHEYGPSMAQVFRDICRSAYTQTGHRGIISVWLHAIPDLGKSASHEHYQELQRWMMERYSVQSGYDPRWGLSVLAAAILIAGGVLAKAFVIGLGGSILTATAIAIALNLAAAGLVEMVTRTGGAVFAAVCILILAALLPLSWVPDSSNWLRENPINAGIIVIAASYIYQRSKKRWVFFAIAFILAAAQIGISFI